MAKPIPKTEAGKQRKVAKTMGEFKEGDLKSSSGQTVTKPKQAVAIALNQTGQSKPPSERKGGSSTQRLSRRLEGRLDARDRR
jgi:hypothetical protein